MPDPTYEELVAENARLRVLLPPDLVPGLTYRVGSKCPENLYVAIPGEKDFELGKLPTAEYARHIADVLNAHSLLHPPGPDFQRLILRAICDPGSFVPRDHDEYPESIPHWGVRAVLVVLADAGLIAKGADL